MTRGGRTLVVAIAALALACACAPAAAARARDVAALQVALHGLGLYAGNVDGIAGPLTAAGVRAFQRRAGLAVDGIAGPRTRAALGRRGRPPYGSRTMRIGDAGWDVAALEFALARHGFPSGALDGVFGTHVQAAVLRFQRFAGLPPAGVAGPATRAALARPPPRAPAWLRPPIAVPPSDGFGPRGDRWHPGVDYPAAAGTPVSAAAAGRVLVAGFLPDGYGERVLVAHGGGVRTLYAHLSAVLVRAGARVGAGATVGLVGASGLATGPHLHFEVIVRGAEVDPLR